MALRDRRWPSWRWIFLLGLVSSLAPVEAHQGASAELARLDARIAARPHDIELLLDRSVVNRRLGDFPAALADLDQVAVLAPGNRRLLVERALTAFAMKDLVRAETNLDLYLSSGAGSVQAFRTRAQLREATGRRGQAIEDYEEALRLAPSPELHLARGRLQEATGALDAAAQGYEEGLRRLGGAVVLRLALIRVDAWLRRYDQAIALVDEVLPSLQVKADWLLQRADLHAAAGRPRDARRDRETALAELDSLLRERSSALWLVSRAKTYLALRREREAVADLERATALAPRLDEARELLRQAQGRLQARRSHSTGERKSR